jgi:hypothetical protein
VTRRWAFGSDKGPGSIGETAPEQSREGRADHESATSRLVRAARLTKGIAPCSVVARRVTTTITGNVRTQLRVQADHRKQCQRFGLRVEAGPNALGIAGNRPAREFRGG